MVRQLQMHRESSLDCVPARATAGAALDAARPSRHDEGAPWEGARQLQGRPLWGDQGSQQEPTVGGTCLSEPRKKPCAH